MLSEAKALDHHLVLIAAPEVLRHPKPVGLRHPKSESFNHLGA